MSSSAEPTEQEKYDSGANTTEVDNTNGSYNQEKPQRRRGCLGFLRKWWWLLLIILVVVCLVVLLPVFLVAVPKTLQEKIDGTTLRIDGIHVTQTQTNSVHLSINGTLTGGGGKSATVDAFNASLYLTDKSPQTPFGYIEMPQTENKALVIANISQEMQIANAQAYADFNTWYMLNESFRMSVKGETYVHTSGLKATKVKFSKTVTLKGLNGFDGMNVTSSTVSITADSEGDNFHGFITIPNPSVLTVEIGNATFHNFFNSTIVGTSNIDNMILYPGDNNLTLRANISQSPIISAVTTQPYCNNGTLPLSFIGTKVVNKGQELPYFEQALKAKMETVYVNVKYDLEKALGGTISCPSS